MVAEPEGVCMHIPPQEYFKDYLVLHKHIPQGAKRRAREGVWGEGVPLPRIEGSRVLLLENF